jgi:hypothetical protein
MEPEFITYQIFNDPALADALAEQFENHHIKYLIVDESLPDNPYVNRGGKAFAVKIKNADFKKANLLLKEDESEAITEIGKDYYLYSFTDDELMEVIIKADEWSPFDFVLARKILAERGKNMSDEDIAAINEKRIAELKVPDAPQTYWIVLGYIFALIGGLLGIFIGWFLMNYKKTLPDGEMVSEYSERDRKHGKRIFYIGIVVLVICIIYKIAPVFEDGY